MAIDRYFLNKDGAVTRRILGKPGEGNVDIAADLEVNATELRVTLAPLSSAHRTRAITALCAELNRTETVFPGSRLLLRYAIRKAF